MSDMEEAPEFTSPAMEAADGGLDDIDMDEALGTEIKITDDGGVVKKILVKGEGWDKPEAGDLVFVHYVGTLMDGTQFDSSRDRGQPFSFNLGEGRVIKGWDLGVASMKRGEKAVLTCRADYAYGEQGSPPKIPGGAALCFEVELLSWQSVKDLCGDGGVIKTVIREGEGWSKPGDRDEALVRLKVRAAPGPGSKPAALLPEEEAAQCPVLWEAGEAGVEFTVSDPTSAGVPSGVAIAAKTMKKGERVSLVLKPEYAYGGAVPAPMGVPAAEAVEVEVELVSWKKVEDVTEDGRVVIKILAEPDDSYRRPNEGAKATVRYVARLPDGTVFDERREGDELVFTTDEDQVPEGFDMCVMKVKKGAKVIATIAPEYAFGDKAHAGPKAEVPPNTTVTYEFELVDFENAKESWEMDDGEKVAAAGVRKDKGNAAFKDGRLDKAIRAYDKALNLINYDKNFAEDIKQQAREVKRGCWLNLAACHLRRQNWKDVSKNCDKVLEIDPFNIKALFRRAQAFMATQDFVEAEEDLRKGLGAEPTNADLLSLSRRLKVLQRDFNKKQSQLYGKMFAARSSHGGGSQGGAAAAAVGAPREGGGLAHGSSADGSNNAVGTAPAAGDAEMTGAA